MTRPMMLSSNGWYPSNNTLCKKEIDDYINEDLFIEGRSPISCIVPHAGWYFCGYLSVNCIRLLKEKNGDINNVVIFGGHLGESNMAILETFDQAETPFGKLQNNKDIINLLNKDERVQTVDFLQDNTIEVILPIVSYFFGTKVKVTAIYFPPNLKIKDTIEKLNKYFGKNAVYIGSTDLTHFGPNYGFISHDNSMTAIDWIKNVNDKKYIDLLLDLKGEESIEYSIKNKSACSSGAAYGALTVAKLNGVKKGLLIGYSTSYEKHKNSSFVGYTGIIY